MHKKARTTRWAVILLPVVLVGAATLPVAEASTTGAAALASGCTLWIENGYYDDMSNIDDAWGFGSGVTGVGTVFCPFHLKDGTTYTHMRLWYRDSWGGDNSVGRCCAN